MGNLIFLDREEVNPGEACPSQIRLDEPVSLIRDDHFVIRSYSPVRTIGGGRVINPIPSKHKRFQQETIDGLAELAEASTEGVIDFHARMAGPTGVTFSQLILMTNVPAKPLENAIAALLNRQTLLLVDKEYRIYVHQNTLDDLKALSCSVLESYHRENPLKTGISKEELKSKFPGSASTKLFTLILNRMIKEGDLALEDDTVRLASHKVSLQVNEQALQQDILTIYRQSKLTPPYFRDVIKKLQVNPASAKGVLNLLIGEKKLVKVKEDLYYDRDAVETLKSELITFLKDNEEISTPVFKDMTGASRKYVIPLIEYFDATHVTIRIGDIRKLRKSQ
jgi:selenocysteine-specific elongation factor